MDRNRLYRVLKIVESVLACIVIFLALRIIHAEWMLSDKASVLSFMVQMWYQYLFLAFALWRLFAGAWKWMC